MTVDQVDPTPAQNSDEYMQALKRLRASAGKPSLRELSRRANAVAAGSLPVSTLSSTLRKDDLPPWRTVSAFLIACRVSANRIEKWRTAWEKLAAADSFPAPTLDSQQAPPREQKNSAENNKTSTIKGKTKLKAPASAEDPSTEETELIRWIQKTLIRPEAHKGEERSGIFEVNHLSSVSPGEARQLFPAKLQPGKDVGCWVQHPLLQYRTLYHCFASGMDADVLADTELPDFFYAKIKCLGQLRVIENDAALWDDDDDRGVAYHTAFIISEVRASKQ